MRSRLIKKENAKNNEPTLYYLDGEKKRYLHSRYNPSEEAKNILKNINFLNYDFFVILGNGLGYILNQLLDNDKVKKVIVIEKDPLLYDKFNLNQIREDKRVEFMIDQDAFTVSEKIVHDFSIFEYNGFYVIESLPVMSMDPEYFKQIMHVLKKHLDQKINQEMTFSALSIPLLNNFLNNIRMFREIKLLNTDHAGNDENRAVIVSAGPSLVKDIEALKKIKDHAVLISVDTALKYLLKNNIQPDFVFSMDPQYYSYFHYYQTQWPDHLTGVFDLFSRFTEIHAEKRSIFFISKNFFSQMIFNDAEMVDSYGSITNFIFQIIKDSFSEIIFIGLDLCYDKMNMYVPYSFINPYFLKRVEKVSTLQDHYFQFYLSRAKRKTVFREKEYSTTFSMINYYQWLKEAFKNRSNVFLSENCIADFDSVKRINIRDLPVMKKRTDIFKTETVGRELLLEKIQPVFLNDCLKDHLNRIMISAQYPNLWKDMSHSAKEKLLNKNWYSFKEKIEILKKI